MSCEALNMKKTEFHNTLPVYFCMVCNQLFHATYAAGATRKKKKRIT